MLLSTFYKKPEVILTTVRSSKHLEQLKAVKCIGMILITYYLTTFEFQNSLLLSFSTVLLLIGLTMTVLTRPQVVLDGYKNNMEITGSREFSHKIRLDPSTVTRVQVQTRSDRKAKTGKNRKGKVLYFPQVVLKNKNNKNGKVKSIDCFELEDLNQANYAAALIAAFTRKQAYDSRGKAITPLGSYIPTRFVEGEQPVSLTRSEYITARG